MAEDSHVARFDMMGLEDSPPVLNVFEMMLLLITVRKDFYRWPTYLTYRRLVEKKNIYESFEVWEM